MAAAVLVHEEVGAANVTRARAAQAAWAGVRLALRLRVLRRARHVLAGMTAELVDAISPELSRSKADTMVAEVLPLLAACRYLEREAARVLRARRLGRRGLPLWLAGVSSTVERVPYGVVLVIAPANYPLFLAGVQALQGLAAGNAVVWKPGLGGGAVAEVFRLAMERAGLPDGLLTVTAETLEAAVAEMRARPDKIFFTGSAAGARAVQRMAAEMSVPIVAELSGCDAVVVLPSADADRVVDALVFGMRLNGSATCMAPRRLLLVGGGHERLVERLLARFAAMEGVLVQEPARQLLRELMEEAASDGATIAGDVRDVLLRPVLVLNGRPEMRVAQSDVFAPVLTVIAVADVGAAVAAHQVCPLRLTAAVFGREQEARRVGDRLGVGTVLVNDLIVPTADPRVPFGGRGASGFGVTRGAEGLLEMTAVKTTCVRRGRSRRHYEATGATHEGLFAGVIAMGHGAGLADRMRGLRQLVKAGKELGSKEKRGEKA